jgi:excisionase family DNA binding protein
MKTTQEKFLTVGQVADMLQVTTRTVHRWISSGELRVHRFSRSVRISEADFKAFIALGRR